MEEKEDTDKLLQTSKSALQSEKALTLTTLRLETDEIFFFLPENRF